MSSSASIHSKRTTFVPDANGTDFPIQNLPYGVFSSPFKSKRLCSRIGDYIIDLFSLAKDGFLVLEDFDIYIFQDDEWNRFFSLGIEYRRSLRLQLADLFDERNLAASNALMPYLIAIKEVKLYVPVVIGDYTDFYSSKEHATNAGSMFRDPANALFPNWLHLPVGYHGRASSIIVSGQDIKRPAGQIPGKEGDPPTYGKTKQLDFELEMGFIIGKANALGEPIEIGKTEEHIAGLILFNDWSARDIQRWEYVPLGPFLGKNFASTVSAWIIEIEALDMVRIYGPEQNPAVLPYLQHSGKTHLDIELEVYLNGQLICSSNTKYLYWSMQQQLAHHTVNGCNINVGDLCASGTISGPTESSYGSMLELAWKGTKPIQMKDGSVRSFLQDGDELQMKAVAKHGDYRIGFGELKTKILA